MLRELRISDFCSTSTGGTPSREQMERYYEGGTIPWVKSGELREALIQTTEEHVTDAALLETNVKLVPAGAILLAMYGATVGRLGTLGIHATTNQAICSIIPDPNVAQTRYVYHAIRGRVPQLLAQRVGGAQPNISQGIVKDLLLPIPPLPEQRRIAAILDQAEALRTKRRAALAKLDTLAQSVFIEMFGDPAINPKHWPSCPVGDLASKFSDGPFGSNLKSEHYTETGIRVIRLQNIGVGQMLDDDLAFISEAHFASLRKHECLPGDLLIGTLGDPNLRACIQPSSLPVALNKADCVQMRPDPKVADAYYLCALLNHPSTERMAQSLILGQTRGRISMGRLRGLEVPLPPLSLQMEFCQRIKAHGHLKQAHRSSLAHLDTLFSSLQHRAFRGEL